jgi:hypothetical protein
MICVDLDMLAENAHDALKKINPIDLAFYFASGKSEGLMRDFFSANLHKELSLVGSEHVTREWRRHDLAILRDDQPIALIEGKSWIYHDAYRQKMLLGEKKSIFRGAFEDIKKLAVARNSFNSPDIFVSTILYGVDVSTNAEDSKMSVTYFDSHEKGIASAGSFAELNAVARENMNKLHNALGATRHFSINAGKYHGMQVEADFWISQIEVSILYEIRESVSRTVFQFKS